MEISQKKNRKRKFRDKGNLRNKEDLGNKKETRFIFILFISLLLLFPGYVPNYLLYLY